MKRSSFTKIVVFLGRDSIIIIIIIIIVELVCVLTGCLPDSYCHKTNLNTLWLLYRRCCLFDLVYSPCVHAHFTVWCFCAAVCARVHARHVTGTTTGRVPLGATCGPSPLSILSGTTRSGEKTFVVDGAGGGPFLCIRVHSQKNTQRCLYYALLVSDGQIISVCCTGWSAPPSPQLLPFLRLNICFCSELLALSLLFGILKMSLC